MISSAGASTILILGASVCETDTNGATPIRNQHPDSSPIPVFIFCIPPLRVIQKTETPK